MAEGIDQAERAKALPKPAQAAYKEIVSRLNDFQLALLTLPVSAGIAPIADSRAALLESVLAALEASR